MSIELIKIVKKVKMEDYKNAFMNLGLPMFQFAEPSPAEKTKITDSVSVTIWDQWDLKMGDITLSDFCNHFKVRSFPLLSLLVPRFSFSTSLTILKRSPPTEKVRLDRYGRLPGRPDGLRASDARPRFATAQEVRPSSCSSHCSLCPSDHLLMNHFTPRSPHHRLRRLIAREKGQKYVDLIVTFENDDGSDVNGPPVRYWLTSKRKKVVKKSPQTPESS